MDMYAQIVTLLDNGIDPAFAASLAGLSLAAAAFFAATADRIIREASERIEYLSSRVDVSNEMGVLDSPYAKELKNRHNAIKDVSEIQASLVKAFLIFVWFVAYTISIAQLVGGNIALPQETMTDVLRLGLHSSDLLLSVLLLSSAGAYLWRGARGIGHYFNVSFESERDAAIKTLATFAAAQRKLSEK